MGIDPKIIGNTFVKLDKLTNELVKQSDDIKVLTAGLANIVNIVSGDDVKTIIESKAKEIKSSDNSLISGLKKSGIQKSVSKINKMEESILNELKGIRSAVCGIANGKGLGGSSKSAEKLDSKAKKLDETSKKISGLVNIIERFKAISLKDLASVSMKSKLASAIIEGLKKTTDTFKKKELDNMIKLSDALPDIMSNMSKAALAMKALPKSTIENIENILIGSKDRKGLIGLSVDLSKQKKNIKEGESAMKGICGTSLLITLTATILAPTAVVGPLAAVGVWFLEKMFFGFGKDGNGGLVRIYKELGKNKKTILNGSLMMVAVAGSTSLAMVLTALGLKAIVSSGATLETMVIAGATLLIEATVVKVVGEMGLKSITMGSLGIVIMGGAFLVNAIAMKKMYEAVDKPDWKKFAMIMATVGSELALTAVIGIIPGGIGVVSLGALGIAAVGVGFLVNSIAMGKMYQAVDKPDWKKFALIMATVGAELGVSFLAGTVFAPALLGAPIIAAVGDAFLKNSTSMAAMYQAVDKPDWKKFAIIMATVGAELGVGLLAGTVFAPALWGAPIIAAVGDAFLSNAEAMKGMYKAVEGASWDKLGIIAATIGGELVIAATAAPLGLLINKGARIIKRVGEAFLTAGMSIKQMTSAIDGIRPDSFGIMKALIKEQANLCKEIAKEAGSKAVRGARIIKRVSMAMSGVGESLSSMMSGFKGGMSPEQMMMMSMAITTEINAAKTAGDSYKDVIVGLGLLPLLSRAFISVGNSVRKLFSDGSLNVSANQVALLGHVVGTEISLVTAAGKSYKKIFSGSIAIKRISSAMSSLMSSMKGFSEISNEDIVASSNAVSSILGAFDGKKIGSSRSIKHLSKFFESLSSPHLTDTMKNMGSLENAAKSISNMDITKANTLRDILKELNNGTESKEDKLIEICTQLINALRLNTDAINAYMNAANSDGKDESKSPGFKITNIKDLAEELSKKISALSVDCDALVDLRINGDGGNEWRIIRA